MKKVLIILIIALSFFKISFADSTGYQPLSPIPGFSNSSNSNISAGASGGSSSTGFADYLKKIYQFGVGLATVLAVLMIMWGGVEYMTTDAIGGKEEGKERIQSAVLGLLLALGSYIILNTINPNLLSLKFAIVETTVKTSDIESAFSNSNSTNTTSNTNSTTQGLTSTGCTASNSGAVTCSTNTTVLKDGEVNQDAISAALESYSQYEGQVTNKNYIGIMDYSQSSSEPRFYIYNTQTGEISSTLASHGSGSDPNNTGYATQFSNIEGSKQSSLGAFIATPYYSTSMGKDALKLNGLETGINDQSDERGLAIHSSDYVTESSCGRSSGCIGVSNQAYAEISPLLSNAFIYNYK